MKDNVFDRNELKMNNSDFAIPLPDPSCDKDCRFHHGIAMTTDMYYPPSYDKHGNNLNPDGNITSGEISCSTCNKNWKYITQYGTTEFSEVT